MVFRGVRYSYITTTRKAKSQVGWKRIREMCWSQVQREVTWMTRMQLRVRSSNCIKILLTWRSIAINRSHFLKSSTQVSANTEAWMKKPYRLSELKIIWMTCLWGFWRSPYMIKPGTSLSKVRRKMKMTKRRSKRRITCYQYWRNLTLRTLCLMKNKLFMWRMKHCVAWKRDSWLGLKLFKGDLKKNKRT